MIKLLAVDMDGTCLNSRSRMTGRTLEALRRAAAAGITVVPVTGRCLGCIPHRLAAETLKQDNTPEGEKNRDLFRYAVSSNGALAVDIRKNQVLFQALMLREDALSLLGMCRARGIRLGYASHMGHRYLMEGKLLTMAGRLIYGRDAWGVCCVKDMEQAVRESCREVEELQFYFLSGSAEKELRSLLADCPRLTAAYTGIYGEVYSREASKGNALAALEAYLGIAQEETACIGDGENDLSMFESAGLKIAMGNAVKELKERADYVTDSNRRDGAAKAIERILKLQGL